MQFSNYEAFYISRVSCNINTQYTISLKTLISLDHSIDLTSYAINLTGITKITGNTTITGKLTISGATTINNSLDVNSLNINGTFKAYNNIELYGSTPLIDFHYNNSTSDYTSRIIEQSSGVLTIYNQLKKHDAGYPMWGHDISHTYNVHWDDSNLNFYVDGQLVGSLSDERLKTDIEVVKDNLLNMINEVNIKQFKLNNKNGKISVGIIAQELIALFEKYNLDIKDYDFISETQYKLEDETVYYTVNYEQFSILYQAMLKKKIDSLEERLEKLEERMN